MVALVIDGRRYQFDFDYEVVTHAGWAVTNLKPAIEPDVFIELPRLGEPLMQAVNRVSTVEPDTAARDFAFARADVQPCSATRWATKVKPLRRQGSHRERPWNSYRFGISSRYWPN